MKEKVVNNHRQPLTLDCGEILAAAGTDGATKVVELSEGDRRRHLDTGRIAVIVEPQQAGDAQGKTTRSTKKDE